MASGSVAFYNSDFFFFISLAMAIRYALLSATGHITVEEAERRQCLFCPRPPQPPSNGGGGAGHVCHDIVPQVNLENLIIFRVCPEPQSCGLNVSGPSLGLSAWSQMFVVLSCVELLRNLFRRAEASVGFDFPSVKQRSENR